MIKIATSILNAENRLESINKLNQTTTDYVHIDAMDGIFVPNYQLPVEEVNELGKISSKPFDIHLMLENPKPYIKKLKISNIDCITIHLEINNIGNIIDLIKSYGYKVGIAIKPKTNLNLVNKYIKYVDKIIIMSVEPGFGGQKFIEASIDRINEIRKKRNDIIIEVDGGINNETINSIKDIADIAVVGSYITKKDNYEEAINNLKN